EVDGQPFTVSVDNIDKARLVPDWVALGYGPAKDASGRDARPGKPGRKTNTNNKPAASKPSRAEEIEKMSKDLLLVVDAVANEKGVPESVILEALEAALATAAKKRYLEEDVLTRVAIDPKDGTYETFRRWEVVADDVVMESPDRQIRMMDAVDEAEGVE